MMPNTEIYYSGILPKSVKELIYSINLTNEEVFNFCLEIKEYILLPQYRCCKW